MSEFFNNYLKKQTQFNKNTSITLIEKAGEGNRPKNSTTQIHSLYITQETEKVMKSVEDEAFYVNIIIKDHASNTEISLSSNTCILPHAPFYIEKTITLLPNQSLIIKGNISNNTNTKSLCFVASVIEITED